ncbi:hypothetical protein D3C87_1882340 [compost metagenome]
MVGTGADFSATGALLSPCWIWVSSEIGTISTGSASTSATSKDSGALMLTSAKASASPCSTAEEMRLALIASDHLSCSCRVTRPMFLKPAAEMRAMTCMTVP